MESEKSIRCPNHSQLKSFLIGDVTADLLEKIAQHLECCSLCEGFLENFDSNFEDAFVDELKSQKMHDHELGKLELPVTVPHRLMAAASKVVIEKEDSIPFDAGFRLAQKLETGPCRLGRFELQAVLGVGTFGYVFKAYDSELDRQVALKVQRAGAFASDEDVERFLREAQAVAQLKHPGIVAIYDTVRSEDQVCYLVTELIDGSSLEELLDKREFAFDEAALLVSQIADALSYAHEHGVIHRDIKPSNVIVDHNGQPHVMDFGLAKRDAPNANTVTSAGRIMGTPAYMSPEQARGDSHFVDARSDIFSLGVILYQLITGVLPFQGKNRLLLLQVIEDDPRSPRLLKYSIPKDLETICLKALAKLPSQRYASAEELAADLKRFVQREPIKARPPGYAGRFWRWCRTYPVAASLLFAVPLITLGGFAYLSKLSTYFVQQTALESIRMEADMLEDINEFYSEEVIAHVDPKKISVTQNYATTPHAIPLPFTFMIDAGKRITSDKTGMQVRIYSDYPWRSEGGPNNQFERNALDELSRRFDSMNSLISGVEEANVNFEEDRSYYLFTELAGQPVLRYARAQVMQTSCLGCHNDNSASPKRDWKIGDVAGVLTITRPLKNDILMTQNGLRSAFNIIAVVALLLVGISLSLLWAARQNSMYRTGVAR